MQVGATYEDAASAVINSAVKTMVSEFLVKKADQRDQELVSYKKIATPPDGFCFWHSLNACCKLKEYLKVKRAPNGFATNRRRIDTESKAAKSLRQKACPGRDPETKFPHGYVAVDQIHQAVLKLQLRIRVILDDEAGLKKF